MMTTLSTRSPLLSWINLQRQEVLRSIRHLLILLLHLLLLLHPHTRTQIELILEAGLSSGCRCRRMSPTSPLTRTWTSPCQKPTLVSRQCRSSASRRSQYLRVSLERPFKIKYLLYWTVAAMTLWCYRHSQWSLMGESLLTPRSKLLWCLKSICGARYIRKSKSSTIVGRTESLYVLNASWTMPSMTSSSRMNRPHSR